MNASLRATLVFLAACIGCSPPQADKNDPSTRSKQTKPSPPKTIVGRIEGASMAPVLKGPHFSSTCPSCKFKFPFDAATAARKKQVYCPLCGEMFERDPDAKILPGDKVNISEMGDSGNISRWDIIAYPGAGQHSVKRVLGLPFEKIGFKQGDLHVDGQVMAKSPRAQLQTRILIFDSDHVLDRQLQIQGIEFNSFPINLDAEPVILNYLHHANYESRQKNGKVEDVKDFYGYNQSTSRSLNRCDDLGCELIFENVDSLDRTFHCVVRFQTGKYGKVEFYLKIENGIMTMTILQQGRRVFRVGNKRDSSSKELKVYISLIDGRARYILRLKGDKSVSLNRPPHVEPHANQPAQKITFENLSSHPARLVRMRLFRDIHYFKKLNARPYQLGKEEFFVAGDNVPVSKDSRNSENYPQKSGIIGIVNLPANRP